VRGLGEGLERLDAAEVVRVLHEHGRGLVADLGGQRAAIGRHRHRDDLGADPARVRLEHLPVVRVQRLAHVDLAAPRHAHGHQRCLGGRRGAVVQRGVRDVLTRQLTDHRLELEDRLQRPLADLRLVGGVGGRELPATGQRIDGGRDEVVVGASAEKARDAPRRRVAVRQVPQMRQHGLLPERRTELQLLAHAQRGRNHREQVVKARGAHAREHPLDLVRRMGRVAHLPARSTTCFR
jgi:hypothetical protein